MNQCYRRRFVRILSWMTLQENIILEKQSLTTIVNRKNRDLVWVNTVLILWLPFCPNFLSSGGLSLVTLGEFRNFGRTNCLNGNSVFCSDVNFIITETINKLISTKFCVFFGRSFRDKKVTTYLQIAQNWNLPQSLTNVTCFIDIPSHLRWYAWQMENLEFFQRLLRDFSGSFKKG